MRVDNPILAERMREQATAPIGAADAPLFIANLTVAYADKPALWAIDYTAPVGGLIGIVGPNGAGKSTLLKAVLGLVPTVAGEVRVFGRPIGQARERIAYVPQRSSVDWDFPTTALDVVAMGLYGRIGWFKRVRRRHLNFALERLDQVGMAEFADRQIGQLSGGQQQRVALARALAQDADLMLLDEPLAGVDAATEATILNVLRDLKAQGRTALVVHHDLQTVTDYFDHVALLNGRMIAAGPTGEAFTEATLLDAYGGRLATSEIRAAGAGD